MKEYEEEVKEYEEEEEEEGTVYIDQADTNFPE